MTLVHDSTLNSIAAKVAAGQRLTDDDGERLFGSQDIHGIGRLADLVRRRMHGDRAYYIVNRHINYTNYCVLRCAFCSFCRTYGQPSDGYELTVGQVVAQSRQAYDDGATELHIVGGLHPKLPFEYYLDICRSIRAACPEVHIKAFTAIEIIHFSRIAKPRLTVRQVLERLRHAGLDSLPGGGAEIFDDRVHAEAFRSKVGADGWFDVHRHAHQMGMHSTATMLFGHIETPAERVRHLVAVREQQDRAIEHGGGRFTCLIALPFVPAGSSLSHLPGPTGLDQLKTLAIARLMLDNVAHIKAFWVMLTPKLAQVSLNWGVDDMDGTVSHYEIVEPGQPHAMSVDALKRLIVEAGFTPCQRDSLYRQVHK